MLTLPTTSPRIAVVIPCYRVTRHVLGVLAAIGPEVAAIYCIDDACPDGSGGFIEAGCADPRVTVLRHEVNKGVGGAVMTGYRRALADGCDVVVKIDGDGQMDPRLLPEFVAPLLAGAADYTKGNRFYRLSEVRGMPPVRLFGNAALSFLTKAASGYWTLFDPTNGYTAIHRTALALLPLDEIAERYFFESDMLFQLALLRAVVADVPMRAVYGDETSHLRIHRIIWPFLSKNLRNLGRRLLYNYFLRDFNIASLELLLAVPLLAFGTVFGAVEWRASVDSGATASAGTVMLAALPIIVGTQLLLSAINFDMRAVPTQPLQNKSVGPT